MQIWNYIMPQVIGLFRILEPSDQILGFFEIDNMGQKQIIK